MQPCIHHAKCGHQTLGSPSSLSQVEALVCFSSSRSLKHYTEPYVGRHVINLSLTSEAIHLGSLVASTVFSFRLSFPFVVPRATLNRQCPCVLGLTHP